MTHSETINEIAAALAKAQAEMGGAVKDSANPFFKSKYADLTSVWDACRKPLTKNGLAVLQSPTSDGSRVSVETLLTHTSGQWIAGVVSATAKDESPQAVGSTITYLRRYALQSFAGVAPEDDDAEGATHRPTTATRADVTPDLGADLPHSTVLVTRVDVTPTKNPKVQRYTLTLAGGPDWPANQTSCTTINTKMANVAAKACQEKQPVFLVLEKNQYGFDLKSIDLATDIAATKFQDEDGPIRLEDVPF